MKKKWNSWKDCVIRVEPEDNCQTVHGRGPSVDTYDEKFLVERTVNENIEALENILIRWACVNGVIGNGVFSQKDEIGNVQDHEPIRFNEFDADGKPIFIEPIINEEKDGKTSAIVNPDWLIARNQVEVFVPEKFEYGYKHEWRMVHENGKWHHYYRVNDDGVPKISPDELGIRVWYRQRKPKGS